MKIVTVIGARPQFIKAAAVSREMRVHKNIREIILHTGQHFDKNMSDIFFRELEIQKPKYNLGINSISHGAMTGKMLEEIEKILLKEKPDWVLVYGDTNSTLAGALAAKKLHIKVAHVEAGLRSFNMKMPEEINRILTDRISVVLFCPTSTAVKNLEKEGFKKFSAAIIQSGDVMLDAALYYSKKKIHAHKIPSGNYALCTLHREENTNNESTLRRIISALNSISKKLLVLMPVHPRTRKFLKQHRIKPEFTLIDPVGYLHMLQLLKKCSFVLTDSGGLQKEAYFFNKYCITLREQTEWVELVKAKCNAVVGSDEKKILSANHRFANKTFECDTSIYGNGHAGKIIVEELLKRS